MIEYITERINRVVAQAGEQSTYNWQVMCSSHIYATKAQSHGQWMT